jgi:hypothetical protein
MPPLHATTDLAPVPSPSSSAPHRRYGLDELFPRSAGRGSLSVAVALLLPPPQLLIQLVMLPLLPLIVHLLGLLLWLMMVIWR